MNIVLIGATGAIGSRILDEALRRGHTVSAVTRDPRKLDPRPGMTIRAGSTSDGPGLTQVVKGHDAAVVSVKWNENDVTRIIDVIRKAGVKRCLFVIGAGSLLRKDGRTHLEHMADKGVQPPTSKPASLAYEEIKKVTDLDWTAVSPAASIQPGKRTGKFRLGLDTLLEDKDGQSLISREDFAVAILDELEKGKHIRRRFTAAY
jgi:putative NADH-flavin reductase